MPAPSSRVLQRWEVWRVVWQYSDGVTSSTRPALLIDDRPDPSAPTFRFVLISGQVHAGIPRIRLMPADPGFAMTGLTKESFVYVADVQKIETASVLERLGVLPGYVARAVDAKMQELRRGRAQ